MSGDKAGSGLRSTGRMLLNTLWKRDLFGETTVESNLKKARSHVDNWSPRLFLAETRACAEDLKWGMLGGFKQLQDSHVLRKNG